MNFMTRVGGDILSVTGAIQSDVERHEEAQRGIVRYGEREAGEGGQVGAEVVFGISADVDCFQSSHRLGHKMVEAEVALGIFC